MTFTYNVDNQHTGTTYADGSTVAITRDATGRIVARTVDPAGSAPAVTTRYSFAGEGDVPWAVKTGAATPTVFLPLPGGGFLQVDPVEGGVDNDYVWPPDPVGSNDLSGRAAEFWRGFGAAAITVLALAGTIAWAATVACGLAVAVGIAVAAGAGSYAVANAGTRRFSWGGLAASAALDGVTGGRIPSRLPWARSLQLVYRQVSILNADSNIPALLEMLQRSARVECKYLTGAHLVYAESFVDGGLALEFQHDGHAISWIALGDVASLEYGNSPEDQAEAALIIRSVVTGGAVRYRSMRACWLLCGRDSLDSGVKTLPLGIWAPWQISLEREEPILLRISC